MTKKQKAILQRYRSGLPVSHEELMSLPLAKPPSYKRYPKGGHGSKRRNKVEKSAPKRISAALTRYLKKLNPGKMRGVTHVHMRKLKGCGVTITPVRTIGNPRRRRTARRTTRRRRR